MRRRARLYVTLIAGGIAALLWGGILLHLDLRQRTKIAQTERDMATLATAVREQVEGRLAAADRMLVLVAVDHRDNPWGFDFPTWAARLTALGDPSLRFAYADAAGVVQSATALPEPLPDTWAGDPAFRAQQDRPNAGLFVGRTRQEWPGERWVFDLSRRLDHADGRFGGVVLASIDAEALSADFAALDVGRGGSVALVGRDGFVRARAPALPGLYQRDTRQTAAGAGLFARLDAEEDGTATVRSGLDGQARIFGFRAVGGLPLAVVVGRSLEEVLAPIVQERRQLLALGGALTVAMLLLAHGLLRELERGRRGQAALLALHRDLAAEEARYRLLAESTGDLIVRLGPDLRRHYVSPACRTLLGRTPEELLGGKPTDIMHPEDVGAVRDASARLQSGAVPDNQLTMACRLQHAGGHWVWVEASLRLVHDETGAPNGIVSVLRDIGERRRAEAARAESEWHFRLLAENSSDVVALSGIDGIRRYISPAVTRVLGWAPEQLIGRSVREFVHEDDRPWVEAAQEAFRAGEEENTVTYRHRRPDDTYLWVEGRARLHRDAAGEPAGYVVVLRDATERRAAEARLLDAFERMEQMAQTDALTGIANRRRFEEALSVEWRRAAREETALSLLLLDADNFKRFNDRYGHPAGDACLQLLAEVLESVSRRPGDIAARIGGEEFALLMPNTEEAGAAIVAERLRAAVQARALPHEGNPPTGVVTVSVGAVTLRPQPSRDGGVGRGPAALTAAADEALYAAKAAGRNRVAIAAGPATQPDAAALAA